MSEQVVASLYSPAFPSTWANEGCLYSLATWINGMAFRDINFTPKGRPVIKIAEVKNGITGQTKFTSHDYDIKYFVASGDLLYSWSGQPETSIDAFWWDGPDGWLNQHVFKVIPTREEVEDRFFFYLLKALKPTLVSIAKNKQTTGLGHVTKADLQALQVRYPDLPEQRAIAGVLGALDDLIDTNRRLMQGLEILCHREFERGGFAAEGSMPLSTYVSVSPVYPVPKGAVSFVEMPALSSTGSRIEYVQTRPRASGPRFRNGDTLLARITPSLENGKTAYVDCLPEGETACGSTEFVVMHGEAGIPNEWVYCLARSERFREYAIRQMFGTSGRQRVSAEAVAAFTLAEPSTEALNDFGSFVSPLFGAIAGLGGENACLRSARDELLPLLMSGEVAVSEVVADAAV